MSDKRADGSEGAKPGVGPGPSDRASLQEEEEARRRRTARQRRARGLVPLSDSMRVLVDAVGESKVAADMSAEERYYSRSLDIRQLIAEFLGLPENEGSVWSSQTELHARAANYAGCSLVTAERWIFQFTRVGTDFRLSKVDVGKWMLERRGTGVRP